MGLKSLSFPSQTWTTPLGEVKAGILMCEHQVKRGLGRLPSVSVSPLTGWCEDGSSGVWGAAVSVSH